jgi:hypothetical protein
VDLKGGKRNFVVAELPMPYVSVNYPTIKEDVNRNLRPGGCAGKPYPILHDGNREAAEFQKFIDHRGLLVNFPWGAVAHLGLAAPMPSQ